jgi:mono/diheme cytochrome c family protein
MGSEIKERRLRMKSLAGCAVLYLLAVSGACGADADAGRRLAQLRCAACHIVDHSERNEIADAPPFVAIGRKFDFNADSLIVALRGPHAKMNFSLAGRDADDIAAYIVTLAR